MELQTEDLSDGIMKVILAGGWGVHLIRQFSDRCYYERRIEKNRLQLLFRVPLLESL